jgi:hypothetical protein
MDQLRGGFMPGLLGNGGGAGAGGGFPAPLLDLDFTAGTSVGAQLTTVRAGTAYADSTAGVWTSFATNTPRLTDKGLLIEESRTNVVLQDSDLTDAAWIKTNITAAKDQTGVDGVTNSASKITATAGNGTCLQTITLGSSARWQSAFVKRITGSGIVNMTMDNGTTWTAVTVPANWTRVEIPTQTLANPIVGFRIVTSGDAIAVDFVQNENGAFVTSPIRTTTVAVTRAADVVSRAVSDLTTEYTLFAEALSLNGVQTSGTPTLVQLDNTTLNDRSLISRASTTRAASGTVIAASAATASLTGAAWNDNAIGKAALAVKLDDFALVFNGGTPLTDISGAVPANPTVLRLGSNTAAFFGGYIRRVAYWPSRLTNAQLQSVTG